MSKRKTKEMIEAETELCDKVWYNRHMVRKEKIESGEVPIVDEHTNKPNTRNSITKDIWEGALATARRMEKQYGAENLGPWSDFEWGMINGKLSAIRWAGGDEWDMLDT